MPINRYFIDVPLVEGEEVVLLEEEAHHLLHVTRTRVGEKIELVNGKNALFEGVVSNVGRGKALILVQKGALHPPPSSQIILAQALPRLPRLDTILEKGTELGMTTLLLFPGERSEKSQLTPSSMKRMEKVMVGAMKQCGRLDLPTLKVMPTLHSWESLPKNAYFGDVEKGAPHFKLEKPLDTVCFFVGPESGFSENEISFLRERQVEGVKLNPHILRTDTAAIAALVLLTSSI